MNFFNIDKDKKLLLACSYGPDSMALFSMLKDKGWTFSVAHVNYHLRKESDDEEKQLREYCTKNNIELFVYDVKEKIEKNIEKQCRDIRYKFFQKIYSENGFDYLLVAHHQDDLLETYIMQKNRQNLPKFYGISKKTEILGMNVIRPLLGYTKRELYQYCQDKNIPFAIDKTNLENHYLRNRIRHEIIEKMSDEERLNTLEEIALSNNKLEIMFSKFNRVDLHDVSVLVGLSDDFNEFRYAINAIAEEVKDNPKLSKSHCKEVLKLLKSKKPNLESKIVSNLYFKKEYGRAYFLLQNSEETHYFYLLNAPSKLNTPYFCLDFTGDSSNRNVYAKDYPIIIRNANKDDEYQIKGYSVKVRRLFIDWKMPASLRKRWPVITNKDGKVIYIPRYQKDFVLTKDVNFIVKTK